MNKDKILFILPFIPYPLKTGGHQAMFNGIKSLVNSKDIYITYESEWDTNDEDEIQQLKNVLDNKIHVFPYKRQKTSINKPKNIFQKIHILLWYIKLFLYNLFGIYNKNKNDYYNVWTEEYTPKDKNRVLFINNIVEKYNIDIVQCEMLQTIPYILTLPNTIKRIFVHHEIGYVREELNVAAKTKNPDIYKEKLAILRKNEVAILNKFDAIITLSNIDKEKLITAGVYIPIYTSFATVDFTENINIESVNYHTITFVGPSCHDPNVVGLNWFLDNCWSKLKTIDPNYHIQIIGDWDKGIIKKIKNKYSNIHFKGFVKDLHSEIKNTIMIVPITVGSGIRMKILEACVNGVPIVSTSVGTEGLPLINNHDILIADSPISFIHAILKLKDQETRIRIINNAREKIIRNYSINALKENREYILKAIK